eukprot:499206_1
MASQNVKQGRFIHNVIEPKSPVSNLETLDPPITKQYENEIKLVVQPSYIFNIEPTKQQMKQMLNLQAQDTHLQIIIKFLNQQDDSNEYKNLPIQIRTNLLQNRYSIDKNNLLKYKEPNHSSQFVVPFTPKMSTQLSKTESGIEINLKEIIMIQSSDPYLMMIKKCLTEKK